MTIDPKKIMWDPVKDGPFIPDLGVLHDTPDTQILPTASQVILHGLDQKPQQLYIERGTVFLLLRLPNELIETILTMVRGNGMFGLTGSESDGYQDIKSLLFVSKAVYRLAISHIYRRITVREVQFASLARTLIANPRRAQEVREVAVYLNSDFVPKSKHFKMHPNALKGVPAPKGSKDKAGKDLKNILFMRNLSILLFRQMCRLEVLDIIGTPSRLFEDSETPLSLPCLKKLSLSGGHNNSGPYFDERQAQRLGRMAPSLETLSLCGTTTNAATLKLFPDTLKTFSMDLDSWLPVGATHVRQIPITPYVPGAALGFTTCTIRADPSRTESPYWSHHMQDILRCCPQVKSLTLLLEWEFRCVPYLRMKPPRFPVVPHIRLEDVLTPCRKTLQSLRIEERGPGEFVHLTAESFAEFVSLESLEISSGIVTRGSDAERQRKQGAMKFFLEHLPSSLRCLKMHKGDEEVDSELAAFVEKIDSERFPSFKTLETWTTARDWPCSTRLERVCKQKGIKLSYQDTYYSISNPPPRPHPGRTLLARPSV